MSQSNSNNGNENLVVILFVLVGMVGYVIWRFINNTAESMGIEPRSAATFIVGVLILFAGVGTAAFRDWGWRGVLRVSAVFTLFLIPAIRDWTVVQPFGLGARFGQYEEVTRTFWGHGLTLLVGYVAFFAIVWFATKDD